jgi:hypothetical protein
MNHPPRDKQSYLDGPTLWADEHTVDVRSLLEILAETQMGPRAK